jgi:hypothetical protein
MESKGTANSGAAAEAAAALKDAEASRATLARRLETPSWFFGSIGAAIAVQIATTALGLAVPSPWRLFGLVAGITLLVAVAALQLVRFRRLNGVWLGGLVSRFIFGTDTFVSVAYGVAFGGAIWADFDARWWLVIFWAVIGGAGYSLLGRRWLRSYRAEPARHARGESIAWLAVLAVAALGGLALLLLYR